MPTPQPEYPVGRCAGPKCGREVIWALDDRNLRRVAVDPVPTAQGKIKLRTGIDSFGRPAVIAHNCTPTELTTTSWGAQLRTAHLTTCPDARRPQTKSRSS